MVILLGLQLMWPWCSGGNNAVVMVEGTLDFEDGGGIYKIDAMVMLL